MSEGTPDIHTAEYDTGLRQTVAMWVRLELAVFRSYVEFNVSRNAVQEDVYILPFD